MKKLFMLAVLFTSLNASAAVVIRSAKIVDTAKGTASDTFMSVQENEDDFIDYCTNPIVGGYLCYFEDGYWDDNPSIEVHCWIQGVNVNQWKLTPSDDNANINTFNGIGNNADGDFYLFCRGDKE